MSDNAAHVDHYIGHSWSLATKSIGMSIGMGIGLLVGIPAAVAAAGIAGPVGAVCAVVALGNTGAQLGSWIGDGIGSSLDSSFGKAKTGWIDTGAATVFIGAENKPAARVEDKALCPGGGALEGAAVLTFNFLAVGIIALGNLVDELEGEGHSAPVIAEGVLRIHIEGFNAARIGCKTTCAAEILEGDPTVFFHGELGRLEGHTHLEDNEGLDDVLWWLDWVGNIAELVGAVAAVVVTGGPLLVFGAGVALVATGAKLVESITGYKPIGFLDDGSHIFEALAEAAQTYRQTPGNYKVKLLAASVKLVSEAVGENIGGTGKLLKRIEELPKPPPVVRPEIKKQRSGWY